ncbi:hypothetical protein [Nocardia iowensis]|uniref:Uncharacterized protein n=1 Tax=Nocardia iowensis TaxID=204891 RepID=A0ABX8RF02_NOCIO|nr:hypothetical protein [Nocardia iowensis]QXN88183.1 hypothetical protein KV110_21435 [Nocardia iowensis]
MTRDTTQTVTTVEVVLPPRPRLRPGRRGPDTDPGGCSNSLSEVAEAMRLAESGTVVGKVVLES